MQTFLPSHIFVSCDISGIRHRSLHSLSTVRHLLDSSRVCLASVLLFQLRQHHLQIDSGAVVSIHLDLAQLFS